MKETDSPTAVIYCRVSSAKQVSEGHGLGSQETRCREYAGHKGYAVAQTFRDEGISGGLIDRPGMQAMLTYLEERCAEGEHIVIIDDISRLARGVVAHIELRTAIAATGAQLASPSIEFGDDPDSILVENLLASVSQHQRQKNTEQVKNRMRARVMNGYWLFAPVPGYRYRKVAGHGKMLVPDEPNATTVRKALEGFASGRFSSIGEVRRYLQSVPSFPRNPQGEVTFDTVRLILERPLYAGYMNVPKWNIRLQPCKHKPLIAFETWTKIQNRLKERAAPIARKDINADFPLRGFVTCTCCERPMTSCWSRGRNATYPYYFCNNKTCPNHRKSIRGDRMEAEFETMLKNLRPTRQLFKCMESLLRHFWQQRLDHGDSEQRLAKTEAARLSTKIDQLMERLVATDSPALVNAYESQIQKLEETRTALTEKAQKFSCPSGSFDDTVRTAFTFLANPWKLWASDSIDDKRMVVKLAFGARLPYHRNEGFRTAAIALPFKALAALNTNKSDLVEPKGVEPSTSRVRF